MDFTIRLAFAADVPAMHCLRIKVLENRLADPQLVTEASYQSYIAAGSIWIAEIGNGIVGFSALDATNATVRALFVDPEAQGSGIGRALLHRMIGWAAKQGIGRLSLSTGKGTRAVGFLQASGMDGSRH